MDEAETMEQRPKQISDLASPSRQKRKLDHSETKHDESNTRPQKRRRHALPLTEMIEREPDIKVEDYGSPADQQVRLRFKTLDELAEDHFLFQDAVRNIVEICLPNSSPVVLKMAEVLAEYKATGAKKGKRTALKRHLKPAMLERLGAFIIDDSKTIDEAAQVLKLVLQKGSAKFGSKFTDALRDILQPAPIEISSGDEETADDDSDMGPHEEIPESTPHCQSVTPGQPNTSVGAGDCVALPPTAISVANEAVVATGPESPAIVPRGLQHTTPNIAETTVESTGAESVHTPLLMGFWGRKLDLSGVRKNMYPLIYANLLGALQERLASLSIPRQDTEEPCCSRSRSLDAINDLKAMICKTKLNDLLTTHQNGHERRNLAMERLERTLDVYVRRHPRIFPELDWRVYGLLVLGRLREDAPQLKRLFPACAKESEMLVSEVCSALQSRIKKTVPGSMTLLPHTHHGLLINPKSWAMNILSSHAGLGAVMRNKFKSLNPKVCVTADIEFLIEDTLEAFALYERRAFPEFSERQWDMIRKRQSKM